MTVKSQNATAAVISSIHNSLKQTQYVLEYGQHGNMYKLCRFRSLSAHLLLAAAPSTLKLQETSRVTDATIQPHDVLPDSPTCPADPVIDWLHILFFHLLSSKDDNVQRMFLVLKPRSITESVWDPVSDEDCDGATTQLIDCFYYESNKAYRNMEEAVLTHEQVSYRRHFCQ